MTPTEITAAARGIRKLLTSQLALCVACYPSTHEDAGQIGTLQSAIADLDRLVQAALSADARIAAIEQAASQSTNDLVAELLQLRAMQRTEHSGLAVTCDENG